MSNAQFVNLNVSNNTILNNLSVDDINDVQSIETINLNTVNLITDNLTINNLMNLDDVEVEKIFFKNAIQPIKFLNNGTQYQLSSSHLKSLYDLGGDNLASKTYVNDKIDNLINGAGSAFDTLKEIETAVRSNSDLYSGITSQMNNKASLSNSNIFNGGLNTFNNNILVNGTINNIDFTNKINSLDNSINSINNSLTNKININDMDDYASLINNNTFTNSLNTFQGNIHVNGTINNFDLANKFNGYDSTIANNQIATTNLLTTVDRIDATVLNIDSKVNKNLSDQTIINNNQSNTNTNLQNQINTNLTNQATINTNQSNTNTSLQNQITTNLTNQGTINTNQSNTNTNLQNQITNNTDILNSYSMDKTNKNIVCNNITSSTGNLYLNKTDINNTIFAENGLNIGIRNNSNTYYAGLSLTHINGLEYKDHTGSTKFQVQPNGNTTITNNLSTSGNITIGNNLSVVGNLTSTGANTLLTIGDVKTSSYTSVNNQLSLVNTSLTDISNDLYGFNIQNLASVNTRIFNFATINNFINWQFPSFKIEILNNRSVITIYGSIYNDSNGNTDINICYDENDYVDIFLKSSNILNYVITNNTTINLYITMPSWFVCNVKDISQQNCSVIIKNQYIGLSNDPFPPIVFYSFNRIYKNIKNRNLTCGYILDYSNGSINKSYAYSPVLCSITNIYFAINGADSCIVNPDYQFLFYTDFAFSGSFITCDNRYGTEPKYFKFSNPNIYKSVRIFWQDGSTIDIDGISSNNNNPPIII